MVGAGERSGERKTVIVTGANRGIGLAVARALVARGCRVVMLSRDRERGERALDDLQGAGPGAAELVVGDLASAREIRAAAAALLQACPRIDVLIHNAGLWPSRLERNEDGLEHAFVVNHLAPFLLNHLLEARLVEGRSRVVQVSAGLYVKGRPDPARTPTGEDFHPLGTYPTTKLCNLLLVPRFADRWRALGVTINAAGDRQSKRLLDCQESSAPPASVDRTPRMRSRSRDDIPANSRGLSASS